jgi:glutathione S-transferase
MKTIKIYGFPQSTYVRTARMVCEEKGVSYEVVPLEFGQASHKALHPFLKMPIAQIDDVTLCETTAIACYLDDVLPGISLQPSASLAKAQMFAMISSCCDYVYSDLVKGPLGDDFTEEKRAKALQDVAIIEQQMAGRAYLVGTTLTLADLFLAPMVGFAVKKEVITDWSKFPSLKKWWAAMQERKSFVATMT